MTKLSDPTSADLQPEPSLPQSGAASVGTAGPVNLRTNIDAVGAERSRRDTAGVSVYWREIHPARRWALAWPREHGAWGILLVSLVTGVAAGGSSLANLRQALWLVVAAMATFCLRTPVENSLPASPLRPRGPAEWRWVILAASTYGVICAFALVMLVRGGALRLIWPLTVIAAGLFAVQAVVKRWGRGGRLPAEIIAAFGLTVAAVAAWAVAAGRLERQALTLWLLNGLFATNQILYVQFRIREARGPKPSQLRNKRLFLASEAITAAVLLACEWESLVPGLALLAFLPAILRGAVWFLRPNHHPLQIHHLGKTELMHAIVFGVLIIAGFRLGIP
jgi:hypothetical protein